MLLAIDVGTTNMKAGIMNEQGDCLAAASRPNRQFHHPDGYMYFDPAVLWKTVAELIREVVEQAGRPPVPAVGITSMAESGLVIGRKSGEPQTMILPWFERCALEQAGKLEQSVDVLQQFVRTGLRPSYKYGLAKLLWLQKYDPASLQNGVWVSVSAYIAHCLTGNIGEEYTLAARTYAFRIDSRAWDTELLEHLDLPTELFPPVLEAGTASGTVVPSLAEELGLQTDTLVCVSGHDHVCASLAVGAIAAGDVYNSMGTAETMVGVLPERPLDRNDYSSGLSFGLHPRKGHLFWMGGHSASGGSVEWLRQLFGVEAPLSYEQVLEELTRADRKPSGIIFLPHLIGSGAPEPNPYAKGAFIGLSSKHGRGDLIKAVLEGNAYQMEAIRRSGEDANRSPIERLLVVGGGTRNRHWLQIKADVSGLELQLPAMMEATLVGAALTAGVAAGIYPDFPGAAAAVRNRDTGIIRPSPETHVQYKRFFEQGYWPLRQPLLAYDEWLHNERMLNAYLR
ncbi:FGGY-family carbohydrate kinase [Paenibacillus gansuensis]|uniref:L-fuculokinase n=1 Tax=Paenibacillus gansuensis TaxID=306542 RepID=A0ABW5P9F2_9BACL